MKRRRVVIIEDLPDIAYLLEVLLAAHFSVTVVTRPEEIAHYQEAVKWDWAHAVICDYGLDQSFTGGDVLAWVAAEHPEVRRILITATSPPPASCAEWSLVKPFYTDQLLAALIEPRDE